MKIDLKWLFFAAFALFALAPLRSQTSPLPEKMPEFPGGIPALMAYMGNNLKYPETAQKEKAEGIVLIKFNVDPDGSITDLRTISKGETPRPDFVLEALRVVRSMPKWTPGEAGGKKVKAEIVLPVKFKLS